jgi:hypothetical protein
MKKSKSLPEAVVGGPGTIDILNNLFRHRYPPRLVFFRTGP